MSETRLICEKGCGMPRAFCKCAETDELPKKKAKQLEEIFKIFQDKGRWDNMKLVRAPWYKKLYRHIRFSYRRWKFKRMISET